jgi:hypothetical protein
MCRLDFGSLHAGYPFAPDHERATPMTSKDTSRDMHDRMANAIRFLSADAIEKANSGHPGLPMGAADIATVLFTRFLAYDPQKPDWADRDRFVLSAGHGSTRSGISASSATRPPATPNGAMPPASRPRPARSARASPMRSAWRSPSAS